MKKFLSRFSVIMLVSILLVGMFIQTNALDAINSNEEKIVKFDYPVKPGTEEWKKLDLSSRRKACEIPENILKKLTTKQLVDIVLEYPYFMDIYAFNSIQVGFKTIYDRFNGLRELLERKDAGSELIEKYKTMNVIEKGNSLQMFDFANIEVLLGQEKILNQLSLSDSNELFEIASIKYEQKKNNVKFGFTVPIFYKTINEQNNVTYYNVYTPQGTAVQVFKMLDYSPDTPEEIQKGNDYVDNNYPSVTIIREGTKGYNCHSYAWYSQSSDNEYWMQNPSAYMTDGSYGLIEHSWATTGTKVYYGSNADHSGIVNGRVLGPPAPGTTLMDLILVESKWGAYGLIKHRIKDCPFEVDEDSDFKFYNKR